jgi:hypothetical protein
MFERLEKVGPRTGTFFLDSYGESLKESSRNPMDTDIPATSVVWLAGSALFSIAGRLTIHRGSRILSDSALADPTWTGDDGDWDGFGVSLFENIGERDSRALSHQPSQNMTCWCLLGSTEYTRYIQYNFVMRRPSPLHGQRITRTTFQPTERSAAPVAANSNYSFRPIRLNCVQ